MKPVDESYREKGMRKRLVETIQKKGIKDEKVLEAVGAIPRHIFLDSVFTEKAYSDEAFPIGEGQTISQPYTVARQTELLEIRPGDKVLEIGTGSGYQASVLAYVGAHVYSVERIKNLHLRAKKIISRLGLEARLFLSDGSVGLQEHAPYDKILVTAAAPSIPKSLLEQLSLGGVLVIPVGESSQEMLRVRRASETGFTTERLGSYRFVPLIGKEGFSA